MTKRRARISTNPPLSRCGVIANSPLGCAVASSLTIVRTRPSCGIGENPYNAGEDTPISVPMMRAGITHVAAIPHRFSEVSQESVYSPVVGMESRTVG
jgi:hypothetical protein